MDKYNCSDRHIDWSDSAQILIVCLYILWFCVDDGNFCDCYFKLDNGASLTSPEMSSAND